MREPLVFQDCANDRLIFTGQTADARFWERQWQAAGPDQIRRINPFVLRETRRYLPTNARVLDAGAGLANTVFGLHHAGYQAYGVDFAAATVAHVSRHAPELALLVADVRTLPFPDAFFDAVWSIGVIEHFYDGYQPIIAEACRVIRPNGYLFVIVPSFSPLRRLKRVLGCYPEAGQTEPAQFYQFAFNPPAIVQAISRMGFELITSKPRGGYLGLAKECGPVGPLLQCLHSSPRPPLIAIRRILDLLLNPLTFHSMFFAFARA